MTRIVFADEPISENRRHGLCCVDCGKLLVDVNDPREGTVPIARRRLRATGTPEMLDEDSRVTWVWEIICVECGGK